MKGLGNAEIFARNLRRYMETSGKLNKDVADIVGVSTATFSEWVNGKKYPRIDNIEKLANYFHIQKSDLIEDHGSADDDAPLTIQTKNKNIASLAHRYPEMAPEMKRVVDLFLEGLFMNTEDQFKKESDE